MTEHYLLLRNLHVILAIVSVAIFALRGSLMLAGSPRVDAAWLRYPSYSVDTLLLTVAFLFTVAHAHHPLGILATVPV